MYSNKRFELTKPVLALDPIVRQGWITIPAGEIIRVLAGPNGEGDQMDVLWEGRKLTMLAIEVAAGGTEITDQPAHRSRAAAATKSVDGSDIDV